MSNVPELAAFTYPTFRGELCANFRVEPLDIPFGHGGRSFRVGGGTYLNFSGQTVKVDPLEVPIDGAAFLLTDPNASTLSDLGLPSSNGLYTMQVMFAYSAYALANQSILPNGSLPVATWQLNSAGKISNLSDIRPSYFNSSIPVNNPGITEIIVGDLTKRATLQNSYFIPSNFDSQPRGKLFVGAGTCKVDNTTTVPWNGAGSPNYFYLGPFIRNGHVAGSVTRPTIQDPANIPDFIAGICHVYLDYPSGLPTFDDIQFPFVRPQLKLSDFLVNQFLPGSSVVPFPGNTFPLAVLLLDSTAAIWKVIDCRPNYL